MRFKPFLQDWGLILFGVMLCLGAFLLRRMAWNAGHSANAFGLLGCHFLRLVLLFLAWFVVVSAFKIATGRDKPPDSRRLTLFEAISVLSIFLGCMGCYPAWPAVLLSVVPLFLAVLLYGKTPEHTTRGMAVGRFGGVVLLFVVSWYVASTTTQQGLRGLGARIEEKSGSDKLVEWSKEMIAAEKAREQARPAVAAAAVALTASPRGQGTLLAASVLIAGRVGDNHRRIEREELPEWVDDLLGQFQGVRGAGVEGSGDNTHVSLYTGGSGFHFRIRVYPSRTTPDPSPLWFGEAPGQWTPQIDLDTEGK
jgi:hypothetical protein